MIGLDYATWLVLLISALTAVSLGHKDLGVALLGMALLSCQIAGKR